MGLQAFRQELPLSARIYVLLTLAAGLPLTAYCLVSAIRDQPPHWILLVAVSVGTGLVISVRAHAVSGRGASRAISGPHGTAFTPADFFLLLGILFFSPEVGALVGAADGLFIGLTMVSQPRRYKVLYDLSVLCLIGWSAGKFFYWTQAGHAPLSPTLIGDPLWLVVSLYLTVSLHVVANTALNSVAIRLSSGRSFRDNLKSHVWLVFPGLVGATGAAFVFFGAQDHYWLSWLAAGPVALLMVYRGNRALGARIEALAELRELFQDSLDALTAFIAVLDEKGRIVAVNQAWRESVAGDRLFGSRIGEGSDYGLACSELASVVADAPAIWGAIRQVQDGQRQQHRLDYDCAPAAPDVWFQLGVSSFQSSKGRRVIVSHQEITDLKLSELRARESERNYRRFFEEDLTGDFVADGAGVLTDCNPAFARILGFASCEAAVGACLVDLFPEPARAEETLENLRRRSKLEYVELELIKVDGGRVNAVANLSGRVGRDGHLLEVRGYLFDDTRRKRLEDELMQARKMDAVGQLAGGIAHQFNNILTLVMGRADYLRRGLAGHAELAEEATLVLNAASQGSRLTKRLQVFDQEADLQAEAVVLDEMVKRMEPMLRKLAGPEIHVVISLEAGEARLSGDPAQIEQVILNLVVNARDAMPRGGELRLQSGFDAGSDLPLRLRVVDTGLGMSPEVRNRIFEPFFTTKPQGRGTGLGLATVYGIVQQSGGRIEVESQLGCGSSFELRFPLEDSLRKPQHLEAAPLDLPRGSETILLVEDQQQIRELVGRTLRENGYRVLVARDGAEAIALAESRQGAIHLLVTDVVMPRMSGWKLAEQIRPRLAPRCRVLFMSGSGGRQSEVEPFRQSPPGSRLYKPFTPGALLRRVRALLDAE